MPRRKQVASGQPDEPKKRRARTRKMKMPFYLEDGVLVEITFATDKMPEYNASHNSLVIATGSAKNGGVVLAATPQHRGAPEPSMTNIRNTRGLGMTRGTMDPVEALSGIPGLTKVDEAVHRTLDSVEASAEAQLDSIAEDTIDEEVVPEDLTVDA